ncbi:PIN domain-containing protein [Achromobacter aegrifaciens]|uniref:PIN domain-containing protein n=1 Tax=Achromobacter aegrifaciens TaxID=1287736 RepID=UPI0028AA2C13|nr:PIN domain-containing protein [Achromobacter aegrifaciens]
MALQTKFVFIDTQSFVKAQLDFDSKALKAFVDACAGDELDHLITTITVREVKDKITSHIEEGLTSVLQFRRKAKILETSHDPIVKGFFAQFDKEAIHAGAQQAFDDFLSESKSSILDLKKVDPDSVFSLYFDRQSPFGDGKKKTEFPDAFSLMAIQSHIAEECVYVVSQDTDLIRFCQDHQKFIHIETLEKVLDILNSHESERAKFIKDYLQEKDGYLRNLIEESVNEASVYNNSTWEDAEVIEHSVTHVGDIEPNIIEIDDESCTVSFEVIVQYEVQVSGPDFVNGMYDKEDGRMYTFDDTIREELEEITLDVECTLYYEVTDGKFVMGEMDVDIHGIHSGIEVSIEEMPEDWR